MKAVFKLYYYVTLKSLRNIPYIYQRYSGCIVRSILLLHKNSKFANVFVFFFMASM